MKNSQNIILWLTIATGIMSCAQHQNQPLYPIMIDNKMGFIDSSGQVIVEPRFDYVGHFNDNLALAIIDSMYGYIGKDGEFKIPCRYNFIDYMKKKIPFLSPYDEITSLRKHIAEKPDTLFNYQHFDELDFSEGKVTFFDSSGKYGYLDVNNKVIIPPAFERVQQFRDGLAGASVRDDSTFSEKWGFINTKGEFVVKPEYSVVEDFYERKAVVTIFYHYDNAWGNKTTGYKLFVIDKMGNILFTPEIDELISSFKNGHAICYSRIYSEIYNSGGYNYIDSVGNYWFDYEKDLKMYKKANYPVYSSTNNILFPVQRLYDDKWGLIPKHYRETLIDYEFQARFKYDELGEFSEGLAKIKLGDRYGYINSDDQIVIKPKYSFVGNFKDGLAFVKEKNIGFSISGYINKKGVMVWSKKIVGK